MKRSVLSFISFACAAFIFIAAPFFTSEAEGTPSGERVDISLSAQETVTIAADGECTYKIIFSSDTYSEDQALANRLRTEMYSKYRASVIYAADTVQETAAEILIGDTNRALSSELKNKIASDTVDDGLVWGIAYKDGKLAYTANSPEAFVRGQGDLLALLGEESFSVPSDIFKTFGISREQYEAEVKAEEDRLAAEKEAARLERIAELKKLNAAFDSSLFGESTAVFDATPFGTPHAYPTAGVHPRVNLDGYMIEDIKRTMSTDEMKYMTELFWSLADMETDGALKTPTVEISTTYNWDSTVISAIEAKALAYLLTGDELYAQEAIYAIKNCILTLVMTADAQGDLFYAYGTVMRIAAQVYDWCYPALTENDKTQIIAGVENRLARKMTIGCPPTDMNGIQGHGTSSQLAVDYAAFAIAIYDERPDWWELVGARLYNEWYPFINFYYRSEYWNQGTSTYADNKIAYHCRSAWTIKVMSGEDPIPGLDKVLYGLLANELPTGNFFPTGDGTSGKGGSTAGAFTLDKTIAVMQALYPSENMQLLAKIYLSNYTKTYITFSGYPYTATMVLVWRAAGSEATADVENKYDEVGTVSHAPYPLGQIIARTAWADENAPVVFMKVGELNVSNHEHEDSGTFQIYYKGLLTCNTGFYGGDGITHSAPYGSLHHRYYHQATISSNGFLIYNPAFSGDDISNPASYYYCGGQLETKDSNTFEDILSEPTSYKGTTTGYAYEYKEDGVTPEYAYIAGDISLAYDSSTVEFFERRMLAVFTDDPDYPMYFYVFDNVTSKDPTFKKTFLLHTTYEPTVDGRVVSSTAEDGKLVLTALNDDVTIESVGGEGKWFLVNGRPCDGTETKSNFWGRAEISVSGSKTTTMLNAMYVTDAANDTYLETKLIENGEGCIAARTADTVVVFAKSNEKNTSELSFTADGSGLLRYYVSGMSSGSWSILVDGVRVANLYSDEESGFLSFTAPSGEVRIVPGNNVKPTNSGSIIYNLGGATLPEGAPEFYIYDEELRLPEPIPAEEGQVFAGWFTDTTYTTKITSIAAGTRGAVKVYAMFYTSYGENYENTAISLSEISKTVNDFIYVGQNKIGSSFTTVSDPATDNTYLLWKKGENDPRFGISEPLNAFLIDRTAITFSLDIALDSDAPAIKSTFRLRGETGNHNIPVFTVNAAGTLLLGGKASYPITTLTDEFTTVTVTVDLLNEMLYAYGEGGETVAEVALSKTSKIGDTPAHEWAAANTNHIFDWYSDANGSASGALRIDNITVKSGFYEDALVPPGALGINYEDLRGATMPDGYPTHFYAGTQISSLPTPTSEILDFLGWYADAELTEPVTSISSSQNESVTLYASWRISEDLPDDKAVIFYDALAGKYELSYSVISIGETLTLGVPEKAGFIFGGWHTDRSLEPEYAVGDEFAATQNGATVLYAKFYKVIEENFEDVEINAESGNTDIDLFRYVAKTGTSYKTVTEGDNTYLLWTKGTADPQYDLRTSLPTILDDATAVSFELDIALASGSSAMNTTFRLRGQSSKYGAHIFGTSSKGVLYLGSDEDNKLFDLSTDFQRVRITVDFASSMIYAFDKDGNGINKIPLSIYAENEITVEEFINSATVYFFNWYCYSSGEETAQLRVDNVSVRSGFLDGVTLPKYVYNVTYENLLLGTMPTDAPTSFFENEGIPVLPTPVSEFHNFVGWYSDAELTQPVTAISTDTNRSVTLYARWELRDDLPEDELLVLYELYGSDHTEKYTVLNRGETLTLGTPVRYGFEFKGWYTSDDFTSDSYVGESYTANAGGAVTLFARFVKTLSEDFEDADVDISSSSDITDSDQIVGSFKYVVLGKTGSAFKTEADGSGNTYLVWTKGTADPAFDMKTSLPDFIEDATKITFSFDVALNSGSPAMRSFLRVRGSSAANSVVLFWTNYNGTVTLGETQTVIANISESFCTVRLRIDIKNEKIQSIDENGAVTAECDFVYPSAYNSIEEYLDTCTSYMFNWYATSKNNEDPSLRIDNVKITCEL